MNEFIRPVQITPEAHLIQSFWKAPGAPVGVHINSMVLASSVSIQQLQCKPRNFGIS